MGNTRTHVASCLVFRVRVTAECAAACVRMLLGESLEQLQQAEADANACDGECIMVEPKERDMPLPEAIKTLKQVCQWACCACFCTCMRVASLGLLCMQVSFSSLRLCDWADKW